jgi:hypothetical protein
LRQLAQASTGQIKSIFQRYWHRVYLLIAYEKDARALIFPLNREHRLRVMNVITPLFFVKISLSETSKSLAIQGFQLSPTGCLHTQLFKALKPFASKDFKTGDRRLD